MVVGVVLDYHFEIAGLLPTKDPGTFIYKLAAKPEEVQGKYYIENIVHCTTCYGC